QRVVFALPHAAARVGHEHEIAQGRQRRRTVTNARPARPYRPYRAAVHGHDPGVALVRVVVGGEQQPSGHDVPLVLPVDGDCLAPQWLDRRIDVGDGGRGGVVGLRIGIGRESTGEYFRSLVEGRTHVRIARVVGRQGHGRNGAAVADGGGQA